MNEYKITEHQYTNYVEFKLYINGTFVMSTTDITEIFTFIQKWIAGQKLTALLKG